MIKKNKGFSLIEILIVSAILALLTAIAIPSMLRHRLDANERATIKNLKVLCDGLNSFAGKNIINSVPSYPANLDALTVNQIAMPEPPYLDISWSDAGSGSVQKSGYRYTYTGTDLDSNGVNERFFLDAAPISYQTSGVRSFYVDEQGAVYGFDNAGAAAGAYGSAALVAAGWSILE
ncbi:MAG: type II secretion system protein [Candidatus Omnitrophica bacterium]|nr:type II secretion system protein [Candidatus Omnitrophota bacterium]